MARCQHQKMYRRQPSMTIPCTALWNVQKPPSPPPMGPLHAGDSHPTHAGQCELQQYNESSIIYPHLAILSLYFEHRRTHEDGFVTPSIINYFCWKGKKSAFTNPGIQPPSWIASDSCRDLSVLLSFNSSWMSDRALCLACARIKCLGSFMDLLHAQCAYSTRSSITFLWSCLWAKQPAPKASFHLGCLRCSQLMSHMLWNVAVGLSEGQVWTCSRRAGPRFDPWHR